MIRSFTIKKLWGYQDYHFDFNEDLNIITGDNGSGKTTILKLMWYMLSGNLRAALLEFPFDSVYLETNSVSITLGKRTIQKNDRHPRDQSPLWGRDELVAEIHIKKTDGTNIFSLWPIPMSELTMLVNEEGPSIAIDTLFFPTYRRIEGNLNERKIIEGFEEYSKRMSHKTHQMLAHADFSDIENMINEVSSDISVRLKPFETAFTNFITTGANSANPALFTQNLERELNQIKVKREELNRPITMLSEYIDQYFLDKNVRITNELILGTRTNVNTVWLKDLSAGEKNFLSFLVYIMAHSNRSIVFIDEPELTLHLDWQRNLLRILLEIAPTSQFFVVTHAPGIRAAYSDKDFWLYENAVPA